MKTVYPPQTKFAGGIKKVLEEQSDQGVFVCIFANYLVSGNYHGFIIWGLFLSEILRDLLFSDTNLITVG